MSLFSSGIFLLLVMCTSAFWFKKKPFHPDTYLSITQLIKKYGYPVETQELTTEDGYMITIHRIPHGKHGDGVNKKPVLLMHGLYGQNENFIVGGIHNASLAYYLADSGYDVWLGTTRGTQHGRKHVKLDPDRDKAHFWNFSYHEIALYDLPTMVDYILDNTEKKKLYYIGHSQGGTIFFILNSLRPEYQNKFIQASLLAPGGFERNYIYTGHNFLALPLIKCHRLITVLAETINLHEFPPTWFSVSKMINGKLGTLFKTIVIKSFKFFIGSLDELDTSLLPLYVRFLPTASYKQLLHFTQAIDSGYFRQWDYGAWENNKVYGAPVPPDYPVKTINIPVAMYYSKGDTQAVWQDIENICDTLPNCTRKFLMENRKWTHFDFVFSVNALKALYRPVVEYMNQYN